MDKTLFKKFDKRKKEGSKKKDEGKEDEPLKPEEFEFKPKVKHIILAAIFFSWMGAFTDSKDSISFDVKFNLSIYLKFLFLFIKNLINFFPFVFFLFRIL